MYLKNLALEGFKSFADSTEIHFNNGFTAIVGPNGCGKSNVSDAIRWVIGEQSSKSLRGTKSVDLIFNGSGSRKPLNRAEISLTLASVPHGLRIANVPNVADEVKVTRRYYRSGESEFYINQIPCRLKDITDFLLDVGISPKVLTVIEQGHIHDIITSKPENRRILIEEAAGILKFKHRRNEAERKLSASEQNLARISDIVKELGRQAESLKRQAAKAERYKTYQSEVKDLSLQIFSKKIIKLSKELESVKEELSNAQKSKEEYQNKTEALNTRLAALKLEIESAHEVLNETREEIHQLSLSLERNEQTVKSNKEHVERLDADNQKAKGEISEMSREIEGSQQEIEQRRKELGGYSDRLNKEGDELESEKQVLGEKKNKLAELQENVARSENKISQRLRDLSDTRSKSASLEARIQFLKDQNLEKNEEIEELSKLLNELEESRKTEEQALTEQSGLLEEMQGERNSLAEQVREGRIKLESLEKNSSQLKEDYISNASLVRSMMELRQKFEGFQSSVKSLMTEEGKPRPIEGMREVLVDVLRAPAEFETAIETVLGDKLQSIIVDEYSDTIKAVDYLNNQKSGRGSFIPLQPKTFSAPPVYLNGNSRVLGLAYDKIECREEYKPLVELLLKNVVVVEDLETALQLHQNPEFTGSIVTQNGEMIDPQGIVTGGQENNDSSGLLNRKRELEELTQKTEVLKAKSESAANDVSDQKGRLMAWENKLKHAEQSVNDQSIKVSHIGKDIESIARDRERHKGKITSIQNSQEKSKEELESLQTQCRQLAKEIEETDAEMNQLHESAEGLRNQLASDRQDIESQVAEMGDRQALIASLIGKRDNTLTEIKRIELQSEVLERRIAQRKNDATQNAEKIVELENQIRELEQNLLKTAREKDSLSETLVQKEESLREKEEEEKNSEEEIRTLNSQVQEQSEKISRAELKQSEIRITTTHLEEKAYDDFNVVLSEVAASLANQMNEAEVEEANERIAELKSKIAKMGEVNLAALSDYQLANERYTFLQGQQEDLAESIQILKDTIERINQTTRDRFLDTFSKVAQNFEEIFSRLFQGGKAKLTLTDPDNPLESGVEISANPAGKNMQNLHLLSGGEKAMTAVALMFSVFKERPSPFCLLDEVDAPLDEANVIRFQEMLKEMAEKTQFIIITHNQKTMSFANSLYGVTMEEKGVSKTVSVSLN